MHNAAHAEELFRSAQLYTDGIEYVAAHLPPAAITAGAGVIAEAAQPFSALIVDKDEVTVIMPRELWDEFAHRLPDHRIATGFRLITFDLPLEFDVVGFMAIVSRVLAEAQVSLLALSAFSRDHILVPMAQFETAWQALHAAQN